MLSENIIADLIRFDECAKCFQKENRDKLIAHLDFSLPFLCLNSYFFVYPYQERSTKAFLLLCGRLFYPLEDEWTMVFELSLIRSAFVRSSFPHIVFFLPDHRITPNTAHTKAGGTLYSSQPPI